MNSPAVYSVLVVDDHPITRLGLRAALEFEPDFEVCGEASDIGGALDFLAHRLPDLVVTDLALEGRGGLELIEQVRVHHPALPVLVFSMHDERLYAARALQAGARGYVTKGEGNEEIVRAARVVLNGGLYPGRAGGVPLRGPAHGRRPDLGDRDPALSSLTDRELEVFLLLGQGYAPRHIAEALRLSVSTVEAYRERLKAKLGLADSALLLRYAVCWLRDHERGAAV